MKALILAAGYAVRLYPLTKAKAKALLPVNGVAVINHIIAKLESIEEIDTIIVVTNSKFISQFRKWRDELECKKQIRIVDDLTRSNKDRRGAIGDIGFAIDKEKIDDDLLVIGGDNLFTGNLKDFLAFSKV
ncbi:MAG: sugar phosphate nucleotidyltransferase, partial [Candidatus Omnitrophica bacterium]|nr:sugar phosphate nucleotidyltransferase [Candidatus Omnitrophota bacterium]